MIVAVLAAVAIVVTVHWALWGSSQKRRDLNGKVTVITGAASGIGRGLAEAMVQAGSIVCLLDIDDIGLKRVLAASQKPSQVHKYTCDVSDARAVGDTMKQLMDEVGDVDILINNAGIVQGKSILNLTTNEIEKTFKVNTLSHFYTTKEVLPSMLSRKDGLIVTISSVMGLNGACKLSDYCSSKFALIGFHESLRLEVLGSGLETLLVCPMAVSSGMFEGTYSSKAPWERFLNSYLIPMITVDDVVSSIITAIQHGNTGELITCAPCWRRFVLPWVIRCVRLLPAQVMDCILILGGAKHGMNSFIGRHQRRNI